ncbi:MAG: endonuclease/exonuclease/phosphatase family protein [Phycisphaeraceae bacterium]|nr:MAG: endonuclease/exonuclease/phosphatase family protein [Phycisphaeraceae bacterium]
MGPTNTNAPTGDHSSASTHVPERRHAPTIRLCLLLTPSLWVLLAATLAHHLWIPSLLRDTLTLALPLTLIAATAALRMRHITPLALNAAACAWILFTLFSPGQRAAIAPPGTAPPGTLPSLRILQLNARADNPNHSAILDTLNNTDLDLAILLECPAELSRSIRSGTALSTLHHVIAPPNPPYTQWIKAFSKWPIEPWPLDTPPDQQPQSNGVLGAILDHPDGPIGIVALHASSPWAPSRWRSGNKTATHAARTARSMLDDGLPVLVIGDLNATPLGARTSHFNATGLRRAKQALTPDGTYPSWAPWPLRVAIDDALVSDHFRIVSWSTRRFPGSDHRAVSIELHTIAP